MLLKACSVGIEELQIRNYYMAKKLDDNAMVSFKALLMANPSRLIPSFICLSGKIYTHQILAGHV
jgi:hypothetical protein